MARAYLYSDFDRQQAHEAETALTALLDDPSPLTRKALAESFASAVDAPHHIVRALAGDQSDIAAIVLARSPLLTASELIDCAVIGDAAAQAAIALRPGLSAPVAAALAEIGAREALITLAVNESAQVPELALRRMIERFGDDGEMREALLSRPHLPTSARVELVNAAASALSSFVVARNWMSQERFERVTCETKEKCAVIIAADCARRQEDAGELVAYLRGCGQLTAGLALRALLSGDSSLFAASLSELSGLSPRRVAGLMADVRSNAFAAVYAKAGFPSALAPVFRAALAAQRELRLDGQCGELSRVLISRALAVCQSEVSAEGSKLIAALRRLEAEAARQEARRDIGRLSGAETASDGAWTVAPELGADASAGALEAVSRLDVAPETVEIEIDMAALEAELLAA